MKNEFYNLGQSSKNLLERDKKLQVNKSEFLKQYDQNLKESTDLKESEELNAAMSAARFSYASAYARSKNRVNKLNEEIKYNEKASLIGMTEMVANVVENALLLDEDEYTALNPEYKDQMRDTIFGLLKEADINDVITNKDTLAIMEYVARKTPTAREGVNLTEDELSNYIASNSPENIDESIKNLSRGVSSKVAQLMEKEQAKVDKINSDVKKAKAPKDKKEKEDEITVDDILAALDANDLTEDDVDAMLANGDISQEVYDAVTEALEDQSDDVEEDISDDDLVDVEDEVSDEDTKMNGNPRKQIQLAPDGTINVNIFESGLIRETPCCGLLESLAVNEAQNMLARGEEYNPDLALANAIMYVTITEAMNEMGLLNVDDKVYSQIISAAGGNVNESAKRVYTKDNGVTELKTEKEYYNDGNDRRVATKKTVTDKVSGKSYTQEESDKPNNGKGNRKYGSYGKSETLTESSVTQWGVQMNTSNANDFAERIRQKKLLKENSQTLHD